MRVRSINPGEASDPARSAALRKILDLDALKARAEAARRSGKTIAHCHGVFDLVHLGHIRHLNSARAEADILAVTITSDEHVNKGPGRPVFSQQLRAEMLAALEVVDWVAIVHEPSAIPAIEAIKPSSYIKGGEYENADDDVTGKIRGEVAAVESHGGKVVFTHDITFSSSNLINRHLDVHDPQLRDFLAEATLAGALPRVLDLIRQVENYSVLLVGDTIIDEYIHVSPLGKPSKENIVSTQYRDREIFPGGVIAAANHVAGYCREVEVVTAIGGEEAYEKLIRETLRPNVRLTVIKQDARPTTRKTRYLNELKKLFELYTMDDAPLGSAAQREFDDILRERSARADVTIVTDFGHGLIKSSSVDTLVKHARFLAVNAQTNSGNHGFNLVTKYSRADYVCVDAPEARLAVGDKFGDIADVITHGLAERIDCSNVVVTHGALGSYAYNGNGAPMHVPAFTKTAVDTIGAGDAFFAVTAPLVRAKGNIDDVAIVGNAVGAIKVSIVGHRSFVDKTALIKYLNALLK